LKKKFGKRFHIHLYTPLNLVTFRTLHRLHKAGLDEIRFHLDMYDTKLWPRLGDARFFKWDVGVEVPVIPANERKTAENYYHLTDFVDGKVDFLNLNELEISDTNACKLVEKGFRAKDKYSYGVKGSEELSLKLLRYIDEMQKQGKCCYNVHYCTAKLKDNVQLRKRIMLRAKNSAKAFDKVNSEGMLVRGAVYYSHSHAKIVNFLRKKLKKKIAAKYFVDRKRKRVLVPVAFVKTYASALKKMNLGKPAIVKEYPTFDCLNVETTFCGLI
jgi:pyruvate formate-lyase activating enzyme-like uncharacterized protein